MRPRAFLGEVFFLLKCEFTFINFLSFTFFIFFLKFIFKGILIKWQEWHFLKTFKFIFKLVLVCWTKFRSRDAKMVGKIDVQVFRRKICESKVIPW